MRRRSPSWRPPVADREVGHSVADLADDAGGLIADDVGRRREHAALAVQQVAALDADRGDLDQQPAGPHHRIVDVLVPEDLGPADLVEHRGLHDVAPFESER